VLPYFASLPPYSADLAARLMSKVDRFYERLPSLRPYQRARRNRQRYYGLPSDSSPFDVSTVAAMGDQGELSAVNVNRFHALGQRILSMTVQDDFGWQPVAANGDTRSQEDSILASSVLDHEKRVSDLRSAFVTAMETALLDAESWICVRWDAAAGALYDRDPVTGAPVYEGRLKVTNHPWWRCVTNVFRHDAKHQWVILTEFANKWDLAARYPVHAERILRLGADHRLILQWQESARGLHWQEDDNEQVPVYTFLHAPSPACPAGREVVFVDGQTILFDGPSPYGEDLPAHRVAPGDMLDTPFGSSVMTDIGALQDVYNLVISSATTSVANHGVPNIAMPRESNISRNDFGGATVWEFDGAVTPQSLDLVKVSGEAWRLAEIVKNDMVELVGLNAVSLGQQIPQLSGAAMALLDSKSLQFATLTIAAYRRAVEVVGTAIVRTYKAFARAPRTLEVIAGEGRRYMLRDFVGSRLGDVERVTVESRSPLMDTTAGKLNMLETLINAGAFQDDPYAGRKIVRVFRTGTLDPALIDVETEDTLIQRENDLIAKGQVPPVLVDDNHVLHMDKHRAVVNNPAVREDPAVLAAYTQHMDAHRMAMPPPMPVGPDGAPLPPGGEGAPADAALGAPMGAGPETPGLPNMPTNPATGEEAPLPPVALQ
jgi:hypothetical protein